MLVNHTKRDQPATTDEKKRTTKRQPFTNKRYKTLHLECLGEVRCERGNHKQGRNNKQATIKSISTINQATKLVNRELCYATNRDIKNKFVAKAQYRIAHFFYNHSKICDKVGGVPDALYNRGKKRHTHIGVRATSP